MRQIVISGSLVLALAVFVNVPKAHSAPKGKAKTATAKAGSEAFGNSDAINENELKVYDYFLASDQLEGRNAPSRGFDTAALYVASHLAEWGLKPGGSTSNTDGPMQPYFMPFELVTKQVNTEDSKITVTAPAPAGGRGGRGGANAGGANAAAAAPGSTAPGSAAPASSPRTTTFEYAKDWTVVAGGRGAPPLETFDISGNVVFAGNGYVISKSKTNPYEGLDVKGRIVVVAGLPAEIAAQQNAAGGRGAAGGPGTTSPLGERCTDFMTPEEAAARNGAVAVISIASFQQLTAMANPNAGGGGRGGGAGGGRGVGANGPAYQVKNFAQPLPCPVVPSITAGLALATGIFQGEKKSAAQIFYASGGTAPQESFALNAATKINLHLAVKSDAGHAENIVGIVEGGDPVKKNEYVVVSAHLDHIGLAAGAPGTHIVNNGADDDGSGSTALLGIAHAFAEGAAKGIRPDRTMIFLWYEGEEKGLWGSQYFAEFPPIDITKVVADLNIDMIGRTKGPGFTDADPTHVLVKPGEIMVVGPNISSDELGKTFEHVNDSYQKLTLNHFYDTTKPDDTHDNLGPQPNGQRIFYRSDHYNFAKVGIPIVFVTEGLHPDYHRTTDTPDKIDFKQMVTVSRTVSAVAWVLATQAGRPKLNEKLPEQLLKDMKSAKDQSWGRITPVLAPLPGTPK